MCSVPEVIERIDADGVAVLSLRHGAVNALDIDLCDAIAAAFEDLATDAARAVVLTGSGRAFSAGADLHGFLQEGEPWVVRFLPALSRMFRAVFTLPKPLVVAVNGHAIAGGCVLACCGDLVLMSSGRIGLPELAVGVPFPVVAAEVVRYAVGDVAARRLMLAARTVGPGEAVTLGLVERVVPAESLLDAAIVAASAMAGGAPEDTFAHTKEQLRREALARMDDHAGEDVRAVQLWARRAADGWTARYLESITGRSRG